VAQVAAAVEEAGRGGKGYAVADVGAGVRGVIVAGTETTSAGC